MHERLLEALGSLAQPRALDAGCGLGGTTFYLHGRIGGRWAGITLSPTQRDRAEREAARRGVGAACRFHLRSYDDELGDLVSDGADLIVAIESLAHSPDPARTLGNLARFLRPGGLLAVVDDVPVEALPDDDADFVGFREGWHTPRIARGETLERGLLEAALDVIHDEDLTPLVILREPEARERRARVSRELGRMLESTAAEQLAAALHGGMMLERLYARGMMRYRMMVGRKGGSG